MTTTNPKSDHLTPQGPISQQLSASSYLQDKKIPQIFESLLAGLMLECPDDHMTYLNRKLDLITEIGAENVAWDTFITHLHPNIARAVQQNFLQSDLLPAEQDQEALGHGESFEPPVTYGSTQLFELTDPMLTDANATELNDSEAVPEF